MSFVEILPAPVSGGRLWRRVAAWLARLPRVEPLTAEAFRAPAPGTTRRVFAGRVIVSSPGSVDGPVAPQDLRRDR